MNIIFYWTAVITLIIFAFTKSVANEEKKIVDAKAFHNRNLGASARELLSDEVYKSLTVEIQYMKGFKPRQQTINQLSIFLNKHLNKPKGINIVLNEIGRKKNTPLNTDSVLAIEKANRTQFVNEDNLAIYILFTNSRHTDKRILGTAYRNTSAVIYGKAIRENSNFRGKLTRQELETAVLLHETGHLLGLVNKGSMAGSNHIDFDYPDHCTNKKCLMYHATETKKLSSVLIKGHIPVLDSNCVADLLANGGKNEPRFKPFLKPL